MNLRDYKKDKSENKENTGNYEQMLKEAERFSKMTEQELMGELLARVKAEKENGSFDKSHLQLYLSLLKDKITKEQRENIEKILNTL